MYIHIHICVIMFIYTKCKHIFEHIYVIYVCFEHIYVCVCSKHIKCMLNIFLYNSYCAVLC